MDKNMGIVIPKPVKSYSVCHFVCHFASGSPLPKILEAPPGHWLKKWIAIL